MCAEGPWGAWGAGGGCAAWGARGAGAGCARGAPGLEAGASSSPIIGSDANVLLPPADQLKKNKKTLKTCTSRLSLFFNRFSATNIKRKISIITYGACGGDVLTLEGERTMF